MLEDIGYNVTVAKNATAALDLLAAPNPIDLLLADIGLPGKLTGLDVVKRAIEIKPDLKIQIMSSYIDQNETPFAELEQYGAILDKPFRKSELAQRLSLAFHPDQG
jgi:CheY-like chemotaxis protein